MVRERSPSEKFYTPGVQGVVSEDFEDGQDRFRTIAQDAQRLLSASLEHALRAGDAQSVDHVCRQAEGDALWLREQFTLNTVSEVAFYQVTSSHLFECNAEIDVDDLPRLVVNENIRSVTIAEA